MTQFSEISHIPRKIFAIYKAKYLNTLMQTFNREGSLYLACNDKNAFFTSEQPKRYKLWSCQKMCDALHYLLAYNVIVWRQRCGHFVADDNLFFTGVFGV